MSPPLPLRSARGLMAVPLRSGRGFMQPHPDLPSFAWSKDGIAFLWLVALIFGFVLWVALHINHP